MKLRFALLVVAVPLLLLGGEGLYRVARSRSQATMTCAEFMKSRPQATWLRLTGCELDYASPGYRESDGQKMPWPVIAKQHATQYGPWHWVDRSSSAIQRHESGRIHHGSMSRAMTKKT